ncbi:MAG: YtxH domain-containing protein [Anaerolineales bacterium]
MQRFGNFMVGIVTGALVGSIAALLLAPMSGEELRTQAAERADAVRQDVLEAYEARVAQLEAELDRLRKPPSEEK